MAKKTTTSPAQEQIQLTDLQKELVLQALETELGGVEVYTNALKCVKNADLKKEWTKYLKQTKHHVQVMLDVCEELGLDSDEMTPGREVVHHIGASLVKAMQMGLSKAPRDGAELVACECVTFAETKDHSNWELMESIAEDADTDERIRQVLQHAADQVEDEEDEHLYHSAGWCRELWKQGLGLYAELPPPEERADVHSAEEAAEAKKRSEEANRPKVLSAAGQKNGGILKPSRAPGTKSKSAKGRSVRAS